jgi:hypothetical protein
MCMKTRFLIGYCMYFTFYVVRFILLILFYQFNFFQREFI